MLHPFPLIWMVGKWRKETEQSSIFIVTVSYSAAYNSYHLYPPDTNDGTLNCEVKEPSLSEIAFLRIFYHRNGAMGKKKQEQSKSFKRRSILCVSFNTCNNLCMQNLLVATSSGPDGLRCCIFRAVTVDLISILEHLMQRFTVFKSLWNCENIKRCDREKKAAKEKKKKKMSISFTLVPSWDHSCLIHTIWGCLIRNYLE